MTTRREMPSSRFRGWALLLLAALFAGSAQAVPFTLTPIGPPRTDGFHTATGVNNAGLVSGTVNAGDGSSDAFIWDSQTQTYVPLGPVPPPAVSRGVNGSINKINNSNQMVGTLQGGEANQPYSWQSGVTSAIPLLPNAVSGVAENVGDGGHIVGYNTVNGGSLPFIFAGQGSIALPLLPGMARGDAVDVNTQGDAVGYQQSASQSETRAVVWISGAAIDLGMPNAYALTINDLGIVSGIRVEESSGIFSFFLWEGGQVIDVFSTRGGRPYDSNNLGGIVGTISGVGTQSAFLWDAGAGLLDLNDQIDSLLGWDLIEAYAINDLGQIVGRGTNPLGIAQGFLLTPTGEPFAPLPDAPGDLVPEPASVVLVTAALVALAVTRSRRLKNRKGEHDIKLGSSVP